IAEQPLTELHIVFETRCGCEQCDKRLVVFGFQTVQADGPPIGDEQSACDQLTQAAQRYLASVRGKAGLRPIRLLLALSEFNEHGCTFGVYYRWAVVFEVDYSRDLGRVSGSRLDPEDALCCAAHAFALALTPEGRDRLINE